MSELNRELNRMARVKGTNVWQKYGKVCHIEAARMHAENEANRRSAPGWFGLIEPYPLNELEIEVRCNSEDSMVKPHCFKMKRRVVWDCLNPRQGADDPKPAASEPTNYPSDYTWSVNKQQFIKRGPSHSLNIHGSAYGSKIAHPSESELVLIESHDENGTEWCVSFEGPNPESNSCVRCFDKENAIKLRNLLGSKACLWTKYKGKPQTVIFEEPMDETENFVYEAIKSRQSKDPKPSIAGKSPDAIFVEDPGCQATLEESLAYVTTVMPVTVSQNSVEAYHGLQKLLSIWPVVVSERRATSEAYYKLVCKFRSDWPEEPMAAIVGAIHRSAKACREATPDEKLLVWLDWCINPCSETIVDSVRKNKTASIQVQQHVGPNDLAAKFTEPKSTPSNHFTNPRPASVDIYDKWPSGWRDELNREKPLGECPEAGKTAWVAYARNANVLMNGLRNLIWDWNFASHGRFSDDDERDLIGQRYYELVKLINGNFPHLSWTNIVDYIAKNAMKGRKQSPTGALSLWLFWQCESFKPKKVEFESTEKQVTESTGQQKFDHAFRYNPEVAVHMMRESNKKLAEAFGPSQVKMDAVDAMSEACKIVHRSDEQLKIDKQRKEAHDRAVKMLQNFYGRSPVESARKWFDEALRETDSLLNSFSDEAYEVMSKMFPNGPGRAKVQVQLPVKVPCRWSRDYVSFTCEGLQIEAVVPRENVSVRGSCVLIRMPMKVRK